MNVWKQCGFARMSVYLLVFFVLQPLFAHADRTSCVLVEDAVQPVSLKNEPSQKRDCGVAAQVLRDFTAWLAGSQTLTVAERTDMLAEFKASWDGCYKTVATDARAFMQQYESVRPPLFQGHATVNPMMLAAESQILYLVQQWVFDHEFVPGKLDTVAGLAFEAAEVFPGPVSASAGRGDATLSVSATYNTDPGYYLNRQETVRRMTGYYAAPGELVTVEVAPRFAGQGLRVMVGAHQENLARHWDAFNRFPRVGNTFPIDAAVTEVANPFGGGIYISVPEGTNLGEMDITLRGVVKTPYFSIRTGAHTTPASWESELAQAGVAWFDWESDYFMITLPVSMVRDIYDPTDILEKWSRSMVNYNRLAGRPLQRIRAEYFSIDRQIAYRGTAMPAQYPVMTGDSSVPFTTGNPWWSPLNVRNGHIPNDIIFHELGHLHNMPTMQHEIESNVNLPAVFIYNEIYGLDIDQALVHSRHQLFTRDEAAVDWMISSTFRAGRRIGMNQDEYPHPWNELAYQQRGHAKWVDIAALFDWDALGAINRVFYEANRDVGHRYIWLNDDDAVIRTASQVLNANLAPLFEFWGIAPSDALFQELAHLPRPQKILERLRRYRAVAPTSAAEFRYYHDRLKDHYRDPNGRARFDRYLETFDDAAGQVVAQRVDAIIAKYYGEEAVGRIPQALDLPGLQLYLSADTIIASDGERVREWRDQSGNNHHATPRRNVNPNDPDSAPRFLLHGTDGKPVVRFNGEPREGMVIDRNLNLGRPYTVFLVDAYISEGWHRGRSLNSLGPQNWVLGRWDRRVTHYADGWVGPVGGDAPVDTFAVHAATGDETRSRSFHNGLLVGESTESLGMPGRLGLVAHGGWNSYTRSDLDVSEIIVYDRVLSETELKAVNDYLTRKYLQPHVLPEEGLQVVLRADAVSTGDGDPVTTWGDQSGQANHGVAVPRYGDFRPTFLTGDAERPAVVRFNGSEQDGMDLNPNWRLQRPYTVFLVDAYSSAGPYRGRGLHALDTNWLLGRWSYRTSHYAEGWVGDYHTWADDDVFDVFVAVGTAEESRYYRNGRDETQSTAPSAVPGRLGFAAHSGLFNQEVSDLDVAEVYIFDRELTETEIALVTRYLKAKYRNP